MGIYPSSHFHSWNGAQQKTDSYFEQHRFEKAVNLTLSSETETIEHPLQTPIFTPVVLDRKEVNPITALPKSVQVFCKASLMYLTRQNKLAKRLSGKFISVPPWDTEPCGEVHPAPIICTTHIPLAPHLFSPILSRKLSFTNPEWDLKQVQHFTTLSPKTWV